MFDFASFLENAAQAAEARAENKPAKREKVVRRERGVDADGAPIFEIELDDYGRPVVEDCFGRTIYVQAEKAKPERLPDPDPYGRAMKGPAMRDIANRARVYAAAYAKAFGEAVTAMPTDWLELCRSLDELVAQRSDIKACAIRAAEVLSRKARGGRPTRPTAPVDCDANTELPPTLSDIFAWLRPAKG